MDWESGARRLAGWIWLLPAAGCAAKGGALDKCHRGAGVRSLLGRADEGQDEGWGCGSGAHGYGTHPTRGAAGRGFWRGVVVAVLSRGQEKGQAAGVVAKRTSSGCCCGRRALHQWTTRGGGSGGVLRRVHGRGLCKTARLLGAAGPLLSFSGRRVRRTCEGRV